MSRATVTVTVLNEAGNAVVVRRRRLTADERRRAARETVREWAKARERAEAEWARWER